MNLTDSFIVKDTVIEVALADITTVDVEVVVNSICNLLHFGSGVSGAFIRAGGFEIERETNRVAMIQEVVPGSVIVTNSGHMSFRHIFHAISSVCGRGTTADILRRCTVKCLAEARKRSVRSIAFPALGTGQMGFDMKEAAAVLIDTVVEDCASQPGLDRIVFCLLRPGAFTSFFRYAVRRSVALETRSSDESSGTRVPDSGESSTDDFSFELAQCPRGFENRTRHAQIVRDVLSHLFVPPLSLPVGPHATNVNSLLVFPNYAQQGFWYLLDQRYGASMVGFVTTNNGISDLRDAIAHISRRLHRSDWGRVGLVVCRGDGSQEPSQAEVDTCRSDELLILALDDFDLSQMLDLKRGGRSPETYLETKISALSLASIEFVDREQQSEKPKARKVFVSYAHEDAEHKQRFDKSLRLMYLQGLIELWSDTEILAGSSWEAEIQTKMEEADIVVCLVSPDFIASSFCFCKELEWALTRHKAGLSLVVPIIVRPCEWNLTPLAELQVIPANSDAKLMPVTQWKDTDVAWLEVSTELRRLIQNTGP